MIPVIIGAAVSYLLLEVLSEVTEKSITEFKEESIITDYAKIFTSSEETVAKIHTTKTINRLIGSTKKFKIGKSGNPKSRNTHHTQFNKMYIIVESRNKSFINKLEAVYNEKYILDKKNKNCKIGSAGKMTDKNGRYFLYFIAT